MSELGAKMSKAKIETSSHAFLRRRLSDAFSDKKMLLSEGSAHEGKVLWQEIPTEGQGTIYILDALMLASEADKLVGELKGKDGEATLQAIFTSHGKFGTPPLSVADAIEHVQSNRRLASNALESRPL